MTDLMAAIACEVESRWRNYLLSGVYLVGSQSRGIAQHDSDVDVMVFFSNNCPHFSIHVDIGGTTVTFVGHDIPTYLRRTESYRFNPGAIRSLHKLRDGHEILGTDSMRAILERAHLASLDLIVLASALLTAIESWSNIRIEDSDAEFGLVVGWVESIAVLELLTRSGALAFSKPKYIYHCFDADDRFDVRSTLDALYCVSSQRASDLLSKVTEAIATIPLGASPFLIRIANDAQSAAMHHAERAFPAARYYHAASLQNDATNSATLANFLAEPHGLETARYRRFVGENFLKNICLHCVGKLRAEPPPIFADIFDTYQCENVMPAGSRRWRNRVLELLEQYLNQ